MGTDDEIQDDEILGGRIEFGGGVAPRPDDVTRPGRKPIRVRLERPNDEEIKRHNVGLGRTY